MSSSTFFTWFFIFYFPLCIAFYKSPVIPEWIDEAMTLLLFLYTLMRLGKIRKPRVKKEFGAYFLIMLLYAVYSLLMAVNVRASVFLDFQQQVRPYIVFYCTCLLAPQLRPVQKKYIMWVMYATILLYLPTALGRGSDVAIGQLCMNCAMMYYFFKPVTKRNTLIAIAIVTLGLIGGKSKYFGEYIAFVGIFYFLKNRMKFDSAKTIVYFSLLTVVILFFTWEKFDAYYVSGMDAEGWERMARPETYKAAFKILFDYFPFGSGLGTFATNAAAVYYSPLLYKYGLNDIWGMTPNFRSFIADAFYPTLAEYGMVGVFLFGAFWKRRLMAIQRMPELKYYKVGLMAFLALALESVADTSYLSGKGMGYFMILGMVIASADAQRRKPMHEVQTINSEKPEVLEDESNHNSPVP